MSTQLAAIEVIEAEMQQDLLGWLTAVRDDARTYDRAEITDTDDGPDAEPYIDVRLQVMPGDGTYSFDDDGPNYTFWSGDPSYDSDGRGYWGCGSVSPDDDEVALIETARDLVSQALDAAAECLS